MTAQIIPFPARPEPTLDLLDPRVDLLDREVADLVRNLVHYRNLAVATRSPIYVRLVIVLCERIEERLAGAAAAL